MSTYRERRGAHRPAGLGPAGTIPWLVAAVLVIGIVAYGLGWVGGGSGGDEAGPSTTPASTSSHRSSSTTRTTTRTTRPTATSTSSSTSASPSSTVDPTQQLTVLNATRTSGLAAGAASRLRTAGWTIRSTGNYRGAVSATTVFYGSSSLEATAAAVAKDLGTAAVRESADFGASAVTVVLADDYPQ